MNIPEHLVVLTGAGMSAESGIATFRGAGGLWEGHRVEDVATPAAWDRNPELVTRFYNERRKAVWEAEPNAGHHQLAAWQDRMRSRSSPKTWTTCTNARVPNTCCTCTENYPKARSCGPNAEMYPLNHWEMKTSDRCPAGYPLRPHIVWFGEAVPKMAEAFPLVKQADCVLVIGTSLQVYPAAQLAFESAPGVPLHVIDPTADVLDVPDATAWPCAASEGLARLNARWFA